MLRPIHLAMSFCLGAALVLMVAAAPQVSQTAEDVIAVTKAQWKAGIQKDTSGAMRNVHPECTEFDADYPTRIEGRDMLRRLREGWSQGGGGLITAEMTNEKVQVYGDVAILSYNFLGQVKTGEGEIKPTSSKSTRVYVKERGQWWLVHANFAPVVAPE